MREKNMRHAGAKQVLALTCLVGGVSSIAETADRQATQGDRVLEEVVVTATKREEGLQQVGIAVTALTANELQDAGVEGVRRLTLAVPGYTGGRNFVGLQPVIRGIGSSGVSLGDEPNVALYIDGVYQPSSHANTIDLVEVERVEVLRGPQGTIFGRNATGGLINVATADPEFTFGGRVYGKYGRFEGADNTSLKGFVTGPLSESVAANFAVLYRENGGYIDDIGQGGTIGESDALNVRGKVLFEPSDWARLVLSAAHNDNMDTAANAAIPTDGNTIASGVPGAVFATEPYDYAGTINPLMEVETTNISLSGSFAFDEVTLESTTAFYEDEIYQTSDNDASTVPVGHNWVDFGNKSWSQEVRLLSNSAGPISWIAGAYAFYLEGTADIAVFTGVPPTYETVNELSVTPSMDTTAYAGFAEGTYDLAQSLQLTLGARYSNEKRTFQPVINGAEPFDEVDTTFSKWTYRGTIQYFLTSNTNLYVTYSTGFKSGVFNTFGASPEATEPETVGALEVGVKSSPLPWLRVNLAAFDYDYEDLQVTSREPNSPRYLLLNAARADIKGAEIEFQAAFTPNFNVRFAGSYLDATYDSFPQAQVFVPSGSGGNDVTTQDVAGNDLRRAPRYTLSLRGNWDREFAEGRLTISGNVFHSDRVYYDFANRLYQPSYTLLNGEVAWSSPDEDWRFSLYGTNLTDERVYQQISDNSFAYFHTYERPREIGFSVEYNFWGN